MFGSRATTAIIPGLAAAALVLTACSSEQGADEVRLITYDSYSISEDTLAAFTEQTGIQVSVIPSGDAGEIVNRALLTKENPEGDVLFGIDDSLLSRALEEGLFTAYEAADLDVVPTELRVDTENRVTPIDTGEVCLNYDIAALAERGLEPPASLADLAEPEYADTLVVQNPATSSPGLAFLLATVAEFGEDGYLAYWEQLRDNGVQVDNSWDSAYYTSFTGGGSGGDRPIVVSYASSPAAGVYFSEDPTAEAPTAAVLSGCYRQIEFAGVLANSPNQTAAQQFIDFMLSETYQADIPLNMWVYPAREGIELPEVFQYAPAPDEALSLPADEVADNREEWVEAWTDTMQR